MFLMSKVRRLSKNSKKRNGRGNSVLDVHAEENGTLNWFESDAVWDNDGE